MFRLRLVGLAAALVLSRLAAAQTPTVTPVAQTPVVASAPVLPVIWANPFDVTQSLVYASDGSGGMAFYALNGAAPTAPGSINVSDVAGVAIAYDVPVQGQVRDYLIVATANGKTLSFYPLDGKTGVPSQANGTFNVLTSSGSTLDRVAVYRSPITGGFYVFVSDRTGNIEQWQLVELGNGTIGGNQVARTGLSLGERVGGMIADETNQQIYVTGVSTGLWRFSAEPGNSGLTLVDSTSGSLQLVAPLGGLTLYRAHGAGYLVVADLGNSDFAVYRRGATGSTDYLTRFLIGSGNGIDGVQNPRGIAAMSFALGSQFPTGLFVSDDAVTSQNGPDLKFVQWGSIATAAGLAAPDVTDNPHTAPDGGIADGGITDGGVTDGGTGGTTSRGSGCSVAGGSMGGLLLLALFAFPLLRRRSA